MSTVAPAHTVAAPESEFSLTVGESTTDFQVRRLLAEEAFDVLELLRIGLRDAFDADAGTAFRGLSAGEESDDEASGGMAALMLRVVLAIPRETLTAAKAALFKQVFYRTDNVPTWTRLRGNESAAFAHLEPVHIYHVLVKAFLVNFRKSFAGVASLIPDGVL